MTELFKAVEGYVKAAFDALDNKLNDLGAKLSAFEARFVQLPRPEKGDRGESGAPGPAGKDADPAEVARLLTPVVEEKVAEVFAKIPSPKDGERGEKGDPGPNGMNGMSAYDIAAAAGFSGDVKAWLESLRGPCGEDGKPAADGKDGRDGEPGRDGKDGKAGADGLNGKDGAPGKDGRDGVDGKDGEPGKQGEPGKDGKDGAAGLDGKAGRDGLDGKDGAPGKDGKEGADGLNGKDGAPGANGKDGRDALDGKDGKDGRDGRDGKDGTPGRDAAMIDPVPGIDQSRTYAAGTWAKHAGGLWLARRDTKEMDGWDCIVNGVAALALEQTSERSLAVKASLSDGQKAVQMLIFPVPLDTGVYKPDAKYAKGDGVTYGGSWFIAQKDEPQGVPGGSPDWRLAAKRGRDGKDGDSKPASSPGKIKVGTS